MRFYDGLRFRGDVDRHFHVIGNPAQVEGAGRVRVHRSVDSLVARSRPPAHRVPDLHAAHRDGAIGVE